MTDTEVTWEPPGPGTWERDLSHAPPAATPAFRRVMSTVMDDAYSEVFEHYGAPLEKISVRMVRGGMYRRVVPLGGEQRADKPVPKPVLWALSRLHPGLRKRNKRAIEVFETNVILEPLAAWETTERHEWIESNTALQAEAIESMSDSELADHVDRIEAQLYAGNRRHHVLHGTDMGPIGDMLAHGTRWGLDLQQMMQMLRGASPATREAGQMGAAIANALRSEGVDPATVSSLDEVRAAGPASAAALDAYLDLYGWRIVSSYDIEGLAVCEVPATVIAVIHAGATWQESDDSEVQDVIASTREKVPSDDRELFDDLLDAARRAYGLRDDNGPLTAEWPIGLTRRAYLEAAGRLVASALLSRDERVFELDTHELAAALRGESPLTTDDLEERAAHREWEATLDPPLFLGDPPGRVDPSAFPYGLRRLTESVLACVALLEKDEGGRPLEGMGIGDATYTGRARLATKPEDVLGTFEAGDVLVAAWTAPTYNSVIASAGAMVVEEGGLLCHAAVIARELGVPAVIGATGALELIEEGAIVTVDPLAGTVTLAS